MKIDFYKYEGTGNDFIIIDNRRGILKEKNAALWKRLCDRRFGIGADGLMLLQKPKTGKKGYDFEMYYVNADGMPTSMCGNGGRCIAHFAKQLGIVKNRTRFLAIDGEHEAVIKKEGVKLKMRDVQVIKTAGSRGREHYILDTGSPHYISFINDVMRADIYKLGRAVRYGRRFKKEGINVNFVETPKNKTALLRTYERGVEDETLSCGTGTVATALVLALLNKSTAKDNCTIKTMGGMLKVWYVKQGNAFTDVWLEGPAKMVYRGQIEITG